MFPALAERLSRNKWFTPQQLSDEIIAWARSVDEQLVDAPLQLDQQGNRPPLQLSMNPSSDQTLSNAMSVTVKGDDDQKKKPTNGDDGDDGFDGLPGFNGLDGDPGDGFTFNVGFNDGDSYSNINLSGGGGVALYGTVVSGSGTKYQISYYPTTGKKAKTDTFEMPTLNPNAYVPPGTAATVFLYQNRKLFTIPVWL